MRYSATLQRKHTKKEKTLIYLVTMINGKRRKYSTRMSVFNSQWNNINSEPNPMCVFRHLILNIKTDFLKECDSQVLKNGFLSHDSLSLFLMDRLSKPIGLLDLE